MKWARREALRTLRAGVRTALRWKIIFSLIITGEHDGISHSDSALERLVLFMPL